MAIEYNNIGYATIYYQMSTTNRSFLNMHYYLKDRGIQNNKFMLTLLDPDLQALDPFDARLNLQAKLKITREVSANYWYFIRECVRIPDSGGSVGGGTKYELHRGNLALNFCLQFNINTMLELPRQQGKTVSTLCWYLYLYNFATSNSVFAFLNKRLDDSKNNLQVLRNIRDALPPYLQMSAVYNSDGKIMKHRESVESIYNNNTKNRIITVASARNKVAAANLLRGRTIPFLWFDEYAFIPYNNIVYLNSIPAFNTAAKNAQRNGTHYGVLITTTPGVLTSDEGIAAFKLKESATQFNERWYDFTYPQLLETLDCNKNSNFVYIRYTYQQLGRDENWFKEICRSMLNEWKDIRREVLLEWAEASDNCPFRKEDLELIRVQVKDPIQKIPLLGGKYEINLYESADLSHYPPIVGVDVSGGFNRDSSAITIIDSKTTRVIADFNCNYISPWDLAQLIYELVTKYMPNAVVNIERNGGFGSSVLHYLVNTSIKRNLFYEIKDKIFEENFTVNGRSIKSTRKTKVYGCDSNKDTRDKLMDILQNRVENHKDKFVSSKIFEEMMHMEVKRSGKIEHSDNSHDDQVFSYLWALYVWYEGKDLMQNWGIRKSVLKTDAELEEKIMTIDEQYKPILDEVAAEMNEEVAKQIATLGKPTMSIGQWFDDEYKKNELAMANIRSSKLGLDAYNKKYNRSSEDGYDSGFFNIPDSVFGDEIQEDINQRFNLRNFK